MKRSGQALIEFIIIMPLIIYLIIGIIDFANIMIKRNTLESKVEDVVTMFRNGETNSTITDFLNKNDEFVTITFASDDKYTTMNIQKKYIPITPGLALILGDPFYIDVERVILND